MSVTDSDQTEPEPGRRLARRRLGDIGLTVLFCLLAIGRCIAMLRAAQDTDWLVAANRGAMALAFGVSAVLPPLRGAPLATRTGWRPRAIALIGGFAILPLSAFPLSWSPHWLLTATTIVIVAAYGWIVWVLWTLKRGFSIFPEARHLMTHGTYRFVRHPHYAASILVYVLMALPRLSGPAVLVAALGIASEIMRARNEEQVLRPVFPAYGDYAARVPAFVPRFGNRVTDVEPASAQPGIGLDRPEDALAA